MAFCPTPIREPSGLTTSTNSSRPGSQSDPSGARLVLPQLFAKTPPNPNPSKAILRTFLGLAGIVINVHFRSLTSAPSCGSLRSRA